MPARTRWLIGDRGEHEGGAHLEQLSAFSGKWKVIGKPSTGCCPVQVIGDLQWKSASEQQTRKLAFLCVCV